MNKTASERPLSYPGGGVGVEGAPVCLTLQPCSVYRLVCLHGKTPCSLYECTPPPQPQFQPGRLFSADLKVHVFRSELLSWELLVISLYITLVCSTHQHKGNAMLASLDENLLYGTSDIRGIIRYT